MQNKDQTPLISVIIPVYNVCKYLAKCIDSVINQTYNNLEIILINDGSTDDSGSLCDYYATTDKRITVIHQHNNGLSAARNRGLDICKGEYIIFVDSDDWVSLQIIEILLRDINSYHVKMSISAFQKITHSMKEPGYSVNTIDLIKKNDAIPRMLLGEWWSACCKLYHKSIFNELRFPVGKTNEDYAVMIRIFEQCDYITYNTTKLYYYLERENSICTSALNIRKFDEVYNGLDVADYVRTAHPDFIHQAEYNLAASLIKMISSVYLDKTRSYLHLLPELYSILNNNFSNFICSQYIPFKQKVFLYVAHYSANGYKLLSIMYYHYKKIKWVVCH